MSHNYKTGDKILVGHHAGEWYKATYLFTRPDGWVVCCYQKEGWQTSMSFKVIAWKNHKMDIPENPPKDKIINQITQKKLDDFVLYQTVKIEYTEEDKRLFPDLFK